MICPIAVALTLQRLVCKCANSFGSKRMVPSFYRRQLGVGVPGSCEAAVHSVCSFMENMPSDHVVVKLDFSNAFNNLHRCEMLTPVRESLPELYPVCYSAYSRASLLFLDHMSSTRKRDHHGSHYFAEFIFSDFSRQSESFSLTKFLRDTPIKQ